MPGRPCSCPKWISRLSAWSVRLPPWWAIRIAAGRWPRALARSPRPTPPSAWSIWCSRSEGAPELAAPTERARVAASKGSGETSTVIMTPETRYARSGDVNIAYQVVGKAPRDLVLVPGWVTNLEVFWEEPACARFLERLASFTRLILFDKRGTGLSDRVSDMPNLETRMDDVRAVMDTVGSDRAALLGYSEGGPMCSLFAATYPLRTTALIMQGSYARRTCAPGYPWGPSAEALGEWMAACLRDWGGPVGFNERWPSAARDERVRQWWARLLRMGASPGGNRALQQMNAEMDVRHVLPAIRVPTLILHSTGDRVFAAAASRFMAEQIPGAKFVEFPGRDHL